MEALIFGLILSADSFSAALALGFKPHTRNDALKFALASGGAEALVTFVGAILGTQIVSRFSHIDHWIAFSLLLFVALHMILDVIKDYRSKGDKIEDGDEFHHFFKILLVSFATSLDGLGVGVGLGVLGKELTPYIVAIGVCAFMATLLGLYLARRVPKKLGPLFTLLGALVLIILAFKMLEI
jgi:manganese efflux pump family protein